MDCLYIWSSFRLVECVVSDALLNFIKSRLAYLYDIDTVELGPQDLGHPVRRHRMWVSGLLKKALHRSSPMAGLLDLMQKRVVASPHIYFALADKYVDEVVLDRAKKFSKVAAPGNKLIYSDTMAEYEKVHLDGYMELREDMIRKGAITAADAFICDLAHTPSAHAKIKTAVLPTLTRNHHLWSHFHSRCMVGFESLAAQGIPTRHILKSMCDAGAGDLASHHVWEPKDILNDLTSSTAKTLAGNGMHLAVVGAVLSWTLAHAVPLGVYQLQLGRPLPAGVVRPDSFADNEDGPSRNFVVGCKFKCKG